MSTTLGTQNLKITETRTGSICVLSLTGRFDHTNAADLMAHLNTLISSGVKSILVDFASVRHFTAAAVRALLVATETAARNAASFVLCSLAGQVRETFEMGALLETFTIHASRDEALARLG